MSLAMMSDLRKLARVAFSSPRAIDDGSIVLNAENNRVSVADSLLGRGSLTVSKGMVRRKIATRANLAPAHYKTLSAFRKAIADGSVDIDKGCRSMREYHRSLSHA